MKIQKLILLSSLFLFVWVQAETITVAVTGSSGDAYENYNTDNVNSDDSIINLGCSNRYTAWGLCGSTANWFAWLDTDLQIDGLHFSSIAIPYGATINHAYITFTSASTQSTDTNITIVGENRSSASLFSTDDKNITDREEAEVAIAWRIDPWIQDQEYNVTVTGIVADAIQRRDWEENSTIVTLFKPGEGCDKPSCFRQFYSHDQNSSVAPLLHIDFTLPPEMPPVMHDIPDILAEVNASFELDISKYVSKTNGDPILDYNLNGTLPHGLSYDASTSIISGTPDILQEQYFTVFATDNDGDSNTDGFVIAVVTPDPYIELRMDECYWMGGSNGVTEDVLDDSKNNLHATSRNKADNSESDSQLCRSAQFINDYTDTEKSDAVYYPDATGIEKGIAKYAPFSISMWLKKNNANNKWMAAIIKVSDDKWDDGWGIVHEIDTNDNEIHFFVNHWSIYAEAKLNNNSWTHVVGTYDGSKIRIYIDGKIKRQSGFSTYTTQSDYTPGKLPLSIGDDISGSDLDDRWQGGIDEVKLWGRTLTDSEVKSIYDNESSGKNYNDGEVRVCSNCTSANIQAQSWELIGVPADSRQEEHTISNTFADDMNGTFNSDWRLYKRVYSDQNNSSWYEHLSSLSDTLEFGVGYWLGSKLNSSWGVDDLTPVDYNATSSGCAAEDTCVEIPLRAVTLNEEDGTSSEIGGPYRYNFSGYIGLKKPVEWKDCRFLVDGVSYTPSDANASGYANKQIWLYSPEDGAAGNNGYITCADDSPEGCKLLPFHGFIVELNSASKGTDIKLLIPKR